MPIRYGTDTPMGAYPAEEVKRVGVYNKDASASRIFPGDFVTLESDGNVAVAAAGDVLLGVSAEGSAASTADTEVLVYDHPDQVFMVQSSGTPAQTNVGNNADILATTGDTTIDRSQHELDQTTVAATTAQLRIMALAPGESAFGANRKLLVRINEHYYAQTAGI